MTSRDFIIEKLEKLVSLFPNLTIRWEYNSDIKCYFIEIVPSEVRHKNEEYVDFEREIYLEFFDKFHNEDISFLSENDYEFSSPTLVKKIFHCEILSSPVDSYKIIWAGSLDYGKPVDITCLNKKLSAKTFTFPSELQTIVKPQKRLNYVFNTFVCENSQQRKGNPISSVKQKVYNVQHQ